MSAGVVSNYQPSLLVWYLTIDHAFLCDASLSAMPVGVLSRYMPRLLVWCLTISHDTFMCGASLLAAPVSVVPRYQTCLLVWCHTIRSCLLVLGHCNPHLYTNQRRMVARLELDLLLQGCHYIRHLLIPCHSQICLLVQCNSIRHTCLVHLFGYTCL